MCRQLVGNTDLACEMTIPFPTASQNYPSSLGKAVPAFGDRFRKVIGDPSNITIERREPPSAGILAQHVKQISRVNGEVAGFRGCVLEQDPHELRARKGDRCDGLRNGSGLVLYFDVLLGRRVYDA